MDRKVLYGVGALILGGLGVAWFKSRNNVKPGTTLILGDSLWAQGAHIDYLNNLPQPWAIDNQSVVGQATTNHLRKAQNLIPTGNYSNVIISGGLNDIGYSTAESIFERLNSIVELAKKHGVSVTITTLSDFQGYVDWNRALDNKALRVNMLIKNLPDVNVLDMRKVLGEPLNRAFDAGDHLHINRAGQAALIPVLQELGFKENN